MKQGKKAGTMKQKSQTLSISVNKTYLDWANETQKESHRCQAAQTGTILAHFPLALIQGIPHSSSSISSWVTVKMRSLWNIMEY